MKVEYKFAYFFTLLYFMMLVLTVIFTYKALILPYIGRISAAVFFFAFQYIVADLIAEVYGFYTCRKVILSSFILLIVFALISSSVGSLNFPSAKVSSIGNVKQQAYADIFSTSIGSAVLFAGAYLLSSMINVQLINKWRILVKGKYFWLRSLGASGIGAFLFVTFNILGFCVFRGLPIETGIKYGVISTAVKFAVFILLAYPNNLVVNALKNIEKEGRENNSIDFQDLINRTS